MLYAWLFLALFIFCLWLFLGRKKYEFIGIRPFVTGEKLPDDPTNLEYLQKYYKKNNTEEHLQNVDIKASWSAFKNEVDEDISYDLKMPEIKSPSDILRASIRRQNELRNSKWKLEAECRHILSEIYGKKFVSTRPIWLKNPETGSLLELDCYNEELKIAAEYNGIQHYVYPNNHHKTYDEFVAQLRRDQFKLKRCDQMGVYLITIPYTVPKDQIKNYIIHYLPENIKKKIKKLNQKSQTYSKIYAA
jgi:hypothetical protein